MGRLSNNPTLLNALHNNTPFLYAHLVKFERPAATNLPASANSFSKHNAKDYAYLTDGAFDVVFDDGTKNTEGVSNGAQTYVANKLLSIGSISDSTEVKVTSSSIVLDATPVDTTFTGSLTVTSTEIQDPSGNTNFFELGFQVDDKIVISGYTGSELRITGFKNTGTATAITYVNVGLTTQPTFTAQTKTITLKSEELTGLIHSSAIDKVSFVHRRVSIYKAFFFADNPHTFIGTPVELFNGVITNASFEEDPEKGAKVTWNLSNFLGDFRQVKGRMTSHEAHQAITATGGTDSSATFDPSYAADRGFEHAEKSISLLATYGDFEKEVKYKKKKILFGLLGSYKEPNGYNLIPVTREVDLRFDLQARYLPIVYGVQRVKGIPIFADVDKDLTINKESSVYIASAICEGPIQSVLNVYVDDKALICMTSDDAIARNPNVSALGSTARDDANNQDVRCIGSAENGQVLIGRTAGTAFFDAANQSDSHIDTDEGDPVQGSGSSDAQNDQTLGGAATSETRQYDSSGLTFEAGETGIVHQKTIKITSPLETVMEFHMGLSDQPSSSILMTQAKTGGGFTIQEREGKLNNPESYWGSAHKLLDTAYAVNNFIIGADGTTMPSVEYVVNGKMLDCYNYDGSYLHSQLPTYTSESHANFKEGDGVVFRDTHTGANLFSGDSITILDKFFYRDFNGNTEYRFRWDLTPARQSELATIGNFYMAKGSNEWHMVTFDAQDIDTTVQIAVAEVFTADVTQTSSGTDAFTGTLSNPTYTSDSVYTLNDADLLIYSQNGNTGEGADEFATRSSVVRGNVTQISGGNGVNIPDTQSTTSIGAEKKITIINQVKLDSNASNVNDIYNGKKINFSRTVGDVGLVIQRTVVDYDGSTKVITLDKDVSQGLIKVGDVTNFTAQTADRPRRISPTEEGGGGAGDLRPSNNFALIALDYIKSHRYGMDIALTEIALEDFQLAAVECDTGSDVEVEFASSVSLTAGTVYRRYQNGHEKWRGTVLATATGTSHTFTNVTGKLASKFNTFAERSSGDLVYDGTSLRRIHSDDGTSTGGNFQIVVQTSFSNNAGTITAPTITKVGSGAGPSTLTMVGDNFTDSSGEQRTTGNPVNSYSFYDSDDILYWKYQGWPEQRQRYVTRHQGNLTVDSAAPALDNLKGILQHFNGLLYMSNGKLRLKVGTGRSGDGQETDALFNDSNSDVNIKVRYITDEDIIGKISLKDEGLNKAQNTVSASISDPALDFNDRSVTFINSDYKREDRGVEKSSNFAVPGITNYFNARMAATQALNFSRFSRYISFTMRPSGLGILPGQLIRINYPRLGWGTGSEVLFRVKSVSIAKDCLVSITGEEHNDSVYLISRNTKSRFFSEEPVTQKIRTPGAPGGVTVETGGNSAPNIVRWTKPVGMGEANSGYEVWRAESFSGDATVPVTTHASRIADIPNGDVVEHSDDAVTTNTAQNFIYWVRAYTVAAPQTSSGVKKSDRKYFGPFNTDSDAGGVGAAYAAQAALIALAESLSIDLTVDNVSIPASQAGVVSDLSNATGTVKVFLGTNELSIGSAFTIGSITTSNGGITTSVTGANYSVTAFPNSIDAGHIDIPVTVLANATTGFQSPVTRTARMVISKAKGGPQGQTGKSVELSASKYVINYGTDATESDSITFTATAREFASTPFFQFFVNGVSKRASFTTATFTLADSDEPAIGGTKTIRVDARDGGASGTVIASDSISIYGVQDGSDAVTGFLTNEAHSVNTTFLGTGGTLTDATGTFTVFVGGTDVTTACSFSIVSENGITTAINTNGVYTTSDLTLDEGVASFKATVPAATAGTANPVEIIKVFTVTKSRNAAPEVKGDLSNPSATVAADSNGFVSTSTLNSVGGTFEIRKDGVLLNAASDTNITFAIQGSASSGLNVAINAQSGVYSISGFTADQGQVTFRATVQVGTSELDSVITIDKVYTISRAPEGTDALIVSITNNPKSLLTTTAGVVDYTDSGTDITAFEGSTQLNYDDSGSPANSTFRIGSATFSGISGGGTGSTVGGNVRRFPNHSTMTADTAFTTYPVTIKRSTGVEETRSAIQHFIKAKQGQTGLTGAAINFIFQRSASQPSTPSASAGVPSGWYDDPDSAPGTGILWAVKGSKVAGGTNFTWEAATQLEGNSVAEVYIYRKNSSSGASGGSYNFVTNVLTPPTGWSTSPPALTANNDEIYVAVGLFSGSSKDTAATTTYSTPVIYAKRQDGSDGAAINLIFQRSANKPSTPSASSGVPSGWYDDPVNATGTTPLWAVKGTKALGATNFVWGDAYQVEGEAVVEIYAYRKNSAGTPSGGSFNFTNSTLTAPSGWSTSPPAITANNDVIYVSVGLATGSKTTTAASISWSAGVIFAQRVDGTDGTDGTNGTNGTDGDNGAAGTRTASGRIFYQSTSTNAPSSPSASGFNFTNSTFASLTSGWGLTPPTYASGNTNKYWYVNYAVSEATFGGTQTITIGSSIQAIGFSGLVTFSAANEVGDGNNALSFGETGTTEIHGNKITTGTISADRITLTSTKVNSALGYTPFNFPSGGSAGQFVKHDGTLGTPPDTNTQYTAGDFNITHLAGYSAASYANASLSFDNIREGLGLPTAANNAALAQDMLGISATPITGITQSLVEQALSIDTGNSGTGFGAKGKQLIQSADTSTAAGLLSLSAFTGKTNEQSLQTAWAGNTTISSGSMILSSSTGITTGTSQTITSTSQSILIDAASSAGPRILITDST